MRRVRLGKTNLLVGAVAFGGIPIQRLSVEEAARVVRAALDLGVDFLDTAYGYGTSEESIGRAIAGRREGLVLASKAPARDGATFRTQMETSFQRLGVAHIDLYQFHNVSAPAHLEAILAPGGAMEVALEARAAGRIGHIGVTSHSLDLAKELVVSGQFETIMFPFNFVTNEPARELLPLCEEHDVGFLSMKPMAGGMLGDARLAFRYLSQFPQIVPVVGIERAEEIAEIVRIVEGPAGLTPEDRRQIVELADELGTRFCRRCDYCQPCQQGIQISAIMNVPTFIRRFPPDKLFSAERVRAIAVARTCVECGECEARCPYELPIREILRENVALYEEAMARHGLRP